MKVTRKERRLIVAYIDEHTQYDSKTVIINRKGEVSAKLDPDKTHNGPHVERFFVGYPDELLYQAKYQAPKQGEKEYQFFGKFKNETPSEQKYFKAIDAFAQAMMDEYGVTEVNQVLRHMMRAVILHANSQLESDWAEYGCRLALLEAKYAGDKCGQDFIELLAWTFPDEIKPLLRSEEDHKVE